MVNVLKGALTRYGKLIWESATRLECNEIILIYCHKGMTFDAFDFYAIPLSLYDVIYDITTIHVINSSTVIDIS